MLWFSLWVATALGQEAVKLEVIHSVHAPKRPALIIRPQVNATSIQVSLDCGGTQANFSGPAKRGAELRIEISVGAGIHTCVGQLDGIFSDGSSGSMPLRFQVAVQDPIQLTVTMDDLDLDGQRVQVHLNQAVAQIDVDVYGETGGTIGNATVGAVSQSPIELAWQQQPGSVVRLAVTATGSSGMSTTLDLFPWSYQIPHEEVVFPSGSSEIPVSEQHKLDAAYQKISAVLMRFAGDKLGFELPMALYVAGYTDTVGNRISNRTLSEKRAATLARWFRTRGFAHPIHFQGFGESALAVQTEDDVDTAANRRALYIIAADTPPVSAALPLKNWKIAR
jgi:outer membrane protein OmpA-like peptidoglycan-associated protein